MVKMNYKDSGVNTKLSDLLVEDLSGFSNQIGKFAANIFINKKDTFVSSCDGVGTKTILASEVKKNMQLSFEWIRKRLCCNGF